MTSMDVLFIAPGNSQGIYQDLAEDYAAIEPPTWALLLAQSCRSIGLNVALCDANAERLKAEYVHRRIQREQPRLICFVVYGQNVNAGTVSMSGATYLSNYLKEQKVDIPICYIGSHVQALPVKTLQDESSIDFAFTNEGVYALRNVLALKTINNEGLATTKGVVWRNDGQITMNPPERVVPADRMDEDLPGYAWDLLPFDKAPLDLYRAPLWHAEYDQAKRSPYAAIQTSLGCQFGCEFCMINISIETTIRKLVLPGIIASCAIGPPISLSMNLISWRSWVFTLLKSQTNYFYSTSEIMNRFAGHLLAGNIVIN